MKRYCGIVWQKSENIIKMNYEAIDRGGEIVKVDILSAKLI